MITNIVFSIFCLFLKNRRLWLRFQCRNEFCMQKYPNKGIFFKICIWLHFQCRNEFCMQKYHNKGIFIGFAENSHFSENFRTGYSMAIFILLVKKLIYTRLAIFGFFPSKKHDSFSFRKFWLKLVEKIINKK